MHFTMDRGAGSPALMGKDTKDPPAIARPALTTRAPAHSTDEQEGSGLELLAFHTGIESAIR